MKKVAIVLGVIVGIVLVAGLWYMGVYNTLVSHNENVNMKWAQVENQYQRRADLVPNLVNTVKGVAKFEQDTLTAVITARSKVGSMQVDSKILDNPDQFKKFEQVQGELSSALSRLMVVMERYPDLKATSNFSDLQAQLEGTENRISVARRDFNEAVMDYNRSVKRAPNNIVASLAGYHEKAYFQSTAGSEKAPEVKF